MSEKQKTIVNSVSIAGTGLHTGNYVTLTFKPAPVNFGYKFKRVDIANSPLIEANADLVVDTSRGTTLEYKGARISTVEHVLAAIFGLGIDNILIELDGVEIPILDGSARLYVEALLNAGIVEQDAEKEYYEIKSNINYNDYEKKVEMVIIPSKEFKVSVLIDYELKVLNTQFASLYKLDDFATEIAPCRTFVFLHELEYLYSNNLIKGGDLSNAIVFVDRVMSEDELERLADLFNKPSVKVLEAGILNNVDLYFNNEPARHKLLDVIGDLALIGKRINGHVIVSRPGHSSNVEFAKIIKSHIKLAVTKKEKPIYDLDKPPLFDINRIRELLPHRPPFLLVDKILEMTDTYVIGLKNVTMNEDFFVGHFPNEPVMPGVLQVEAMAQTGGIMALSSVPDPENYATYFMKIDNVRFRSKVVPGDTLIFRLDLLTPIRRGLCNMKGVAYVGTKVVMEAEMLAQIIKVK
ncbi:MAG: bifunctional UDP-3-O-[3-hydroxymyristoyl] N-acetylglucosamine deacetylase/3-hydroxyacyl-ACP dehydratase [Bacteroidetes bacterium]|nr:bifunctional UDP-3-O-[3-hydroxymyristoyl] N-acetylglucosamine deacetylase/3-hydroxyacyl-ACP dehydratase [Bacteroidota bacterium]